LVMPEAMNPPLESNLNFPAMTASLYQGSCGKEAFQPHFKRIF
jgi:hypothetical protein